MKKIHLLKIQDIEELNTEKGLIFWGLLAASASSCFLAIVSCPKLLLNTFGQLLATFAFGQFLAKSGCMISQVSGCGDQTILPADPPTVKPKPRGLENPKKSVFKKTNSTLWGRGRAVQEGATRCLADSRTALGRGELNRQVCKARRPGGSSR